MRLLLDAHLSGRRIGGPLSRLGHDVTAADAAPGLKSLADEDLLVVATQQERILITCNVRDFAPIAGEWLERGRTYPGCALLVGMTNDEFGVIVRSLTAEFEERPDPARWSNCAIFVSRA